MYSNQRSSYGNDNYRRGRDRNDSYRKQSPRGRSSGGRSDGFAPIDKENEPVSFEKNFYVPTVTMSLEEADVLRKKAGMRLVGNDINLPVGDFVSLGFPKAVVDGFRSKGYESPTPIQAQGWPMALSGRDMVGIADTGSGKTISFVLPALIHAKAQVPLRENDGPIVLILAPTRELVNQIEEVVAEYAGFFNMRSCAVYGGASIVPQKKAIIRGTEILVATPGRLIDLHNQGFCPLGRVSFLVLDEADRMLDMGFEPQLQQIIPGTHKDRQTLMWSATWPKEVRRLACDFMKDFIQVDIGKADKNITQKVEVVHWKDKKNKLLDYMQDRKNDRVIIFCNMKKTCDVIESFLIENGFNATVIHGDKSQGAREAVINSFKNGRKSILIATEVAARGLDVDGVKLVINYDFPNTIDDYVHRIGRTARGLVKEGLAFTMLCDDDRSLAPKLIEYLKTSGQEVPPDLLGMQGRGGSGSSRSFGGRGGGSYGGRNGSQRRFGY